MSTASQTDQTGSCCPPNSEPFLASTYTERGAVRALPEGFKFYTSPTTEPSKKAVIVLPSIFGWSGGRTRNVSDLFGEAGYVSVVPQLLVPPLDGGYDGDGHLHIPDDWLNFTFL